MLQCVVVCCCCCLIVLGFLVIYHYLLILCEFSLRFDLHYYVFTFCICLSFDVVPRSKICASLVLQLFLHFVIFRVRPCLSSSFSICFFQLFPLPFFFCLGLSAVSMYFTHLWSGYLIMCPRYRSWRSSIIVDIVVVLSCLWISLLLILSRFVTPLTLRSSFIHHVSSLFLSAVPMVHVSQQ